VGFPGVTVVDGALCAELPTVGGINPGGKRNKLLMSLASSSAGPIKRGIPTPFVAKRTL
jgi:hypothetical protein